MSVHDDGPPKFAPEVTTAPWAVKVNTEAGKLLSQLTASRAPITSLAFKVALRTMCADMEPAPSITQEDVSRYLKRWFLDEGGAPKVGYAFREHRTAETDPKPGQTFNEYYARETGNADASVDAKPGESEAILDAMAEAAPSAKVGFFDRLKALLERWL